MQDTRQQNENTEEDQSPIFREPVASDLMLSSPEIKLEYDKSSILSISSTSLEPDSSVSVGKTLSDAQNTSNATTLGQQSCGDNPIPHIGPRHDIRIPASTRIPPELFDNILFYLCLGYDPQSNGEESSRIHITASSLVCRYWANLCRRALFRNKELKICSFEEAQTLIKYARQGCPLLVPVHRLIKSISVEQSYDEGKSFCDHIYTLKTGLGILKLTGPVPHGFPPCKLDTPHWTLPPSVATPPSLLSYEEIRVENVRLPSFKHVSKYVGHFVRSPDIYFRNLTWDADGQEPPLRFRTGGSRKVKDNDFFVHAEGCTDNFSLCSLVATLHPRWRSLMHTLPDDESQWITMTIRQTRDMMAGNQACRLRIIGPTEDEPLPTTTINAEFRADDQFWALDFHLCNCAAANSPAPDVRVVCVVLDVGRVGEEVVINVGSLIPYLRHLSMLRLVTLRFDIYEDLLAVMEHRLPLILYPPLVKRRARPCAYMFVCQRNPDYKFRVEASPDEYDYIGIDPITLSPIGSIPRGSVYEHWSKISQVFQ
ncbi:hypothetical protein BDY19DRAFT_999056 [Irpex rosettiformis]|uniref:Uncharacterized protein n=1 Tax=Irpex rosettiformis TaxID=378272 RepID=A0ACB8TLT5_9APHY|nr:hypothetical protein BDY19DRAFT_999056 [Irpex rosettiformis]